VIPIRDSAAGATFAVKVHPRAKRNDISGEVGDALKVSLTAPPVEVLAEVLSVPRSSVSIAAGAGSRQKVIRVTGLSADQLRERLNKHL
jgi:uncharacterized protein YggU (UPF0235/DUF167 family)